MNRNSVGPALTPRGVVVRGLLAFGLVLGIAFVPGRVSAQETGTVTGQTLEVGSGTPIASVQVQIPSLDVGALSGPDGGFTIPEVPVGTYEIQAQRLGYGTVTSSVTVGAGESAAVDFQLEQEALGLDEIVVTGTVGQQRRREVGNSLEQLNLADIDAPQPSTDALLQGRVAGLSIEMNSGQAGDGAAIRLRGNVSAALSNNPLIFIDGIRVKSEPYPNLGASPLGNFAAAFTTATPLNDINPENIERIEVIKGAAATTLYGTEAASGVIQIFTKRGTSGGAPVWNMKIDQGINTPNKYGVFETLSGTPTSEFADFTSAAGGTADYMYQDPWFRDAAYRQGYSLSVRGSSDPVSYSLSGQWEAQDNMFIASGTNNYSLHTNFTLQVNPSTYFDWMTLYSNRNINTIPCGNNVQGVCLNAPRAPTNYIGDGSFEELNKLVTQRDDENIVSRLVTGGTLRFQPTDNLSGRLGVGFDRAGTSGTIVADYGHPSAPLGYISRNETLEELLTVDFASTYSRALSSDLSADVSGGFQFITRDTEFLESFSQDFAGPGEVTVSSGAVTQSSETRTRVITGGFFGQALFGLQDRYFLTLGARVDGNSAFGQDFGWAVYPKLSGSWIVSDEAFFPDLFDEVKLRAAWGQAGRAPGAFDAVRTWEPTAWGTSSAFVPQNVGNPELGPETTTETEVGFDLAALRNRLVVAFTYYRQLTTDALIAVRQTPSAGNWSSQLENVGELRNKGVELTVDAEVFSSDDWGVDLGLTASTNHSEAVDLGGAASFGTGLNTYIVEGQPVPTVQGTLFHNPDATGEPEVTEDHYFGPNVPTLTVVPRASVRVPGGIVVSARGEYQGGHYMRDSASRWAISTGANYPLCWDAWNLIDQGRQAELTQREQLMCILENLDNGHFIYPADYFKLREVSVTIPLTEYVPSVTSASLTLAGTNLWRWLNEDWLAWDPESASGVTGAHSFYNGVYENPAPPRGFMASMRVQF